MCLCLVSYVVTIADCVQACLAGTTGVYHREDVVILCTWILLRLCYLEQTPLAVSSGVIVLATFNVFAMIVVQSMSSDEELPEVLWQCSAP